MIHGSREFILLRFFQLLSPAFNRCVLWKWKCFFHCEFIEKIKKREQRVSNILQSIAMRTFLLFLVSPFIVFGAVNHNSHFTLINSRKLHWRRFSEYVRKKRSTKSYFRRWILNLHSSWQSDREKQINKLHLLNQKELEKAKPNETTKSENIKFSIGFWSFTRCVFSFTSTELTTKVKNTSPISFSGTFTSNEEI